MPAARRSGTNTPCAPKAAAERITAPRLRGSVTPSSATAAARSAPRRRDQILERLVLERRDLQADALVQYAAGHPVQFGAADLQDRDAPVPGGANRLDDPFVEVDALRDVQRGGRHLRPQRLKTGLRPTSSSGASLAGTDFGPVPPGVRSGPERPDPAPPRPAAPRPAAPPRPDVAPPASTCPSRHRWCPSLPAYRSWGSALGGRRPALLLLLPGGALRQFLVAGIALCQGRSSAGRVRPGRRDWPVLPPEPRCGPFLAAPSPGAASYPASVLLSDRPSWPVRGVLDHDTGLPELVAYRVGGRPVLACPGRARCSMASATSGRPLRAGRHPPAATPGRVNRVDAEDVEHRPHPGQGAPGGVLVAAAKAALPSRTVSCSIAIAREVFRSSSIAVANASCSSPARPRPTRSPARCTKPSIRRYAAAASRSASSE